MKILAVPMLLLCSAVHAGFTSDAELREQKKIELTEKRMSHISEIVGRELWYNAECAEYFTSGGRIFKDPVPDNAYLAMKASFYRPSQQYEKVKVLSAEPWQKDNYYVEYTIQLQDGSVAYYSSRLYGSLIDPLNPSESGYGCWFSEDPIVARRKSAEEKEEKEKAASSVQTDYEASRANALREEESETKKRAALAKKPGVHIGMTKRQVIRNSSWGEPEDINTTTTAAGEWEQWIYGDGNYLYFRNGRLVSIQN